MVRSGPDIAPKVVEKINEKHGLKLKRYEEAFEEKKAEVLDNRKEIQLVDPLYEPMIMYPMQIEDLPLCEKCMPIFIKNLNMSAFQKDYRVWVRKEVYRRLQEEKGWREDDLNKIGIDFNKSIERQLRTTLKNLMPRDKTDIKVCLTETHKKPEEYGCREIEYCFGYPDGHPTPWRNRLKSRYGYNLPSIALKELYDLYNELTNTFEMKRLMHLQMTGFLSYKYPSSTHSRFAHVVGTWICGLIALQNVSVVTMKGEKRLLEFLAENDIHREFMASLMLHDIGHAPYSHVLEMNPHLKYDHEETAKSLIKGGSSSKYLELENLLILSYLDLEVGLDEMYGFRNFKNFGTYSNDKFTLVHDIIRRMGLDEDIIIELFSDEYYSDPAVRALKGLVHGIMDIDRIDHIYRDLHYNSFKTMGIPITSLFHGMKIHYEEYEESGEEPWIELSQEVVPIVETLLAAREQSNKAIFDNPVNNFYISILNSAISDGVAMMPLLKYYIPYLTDEALLHVLANKDLFHNFSPTRKTGIITSSCFEHQDYVYSTYRIREAIFKNERVTFEILNKELDEDILTCILAVMKKVDQKMEMTWYSFFKDIRGAYGLGSNKHQELEEVKKGEVFGKGYVKAPTTKTYIGEKIEENIIEKKLKSYIEGITWYGDQNRSYTFTLFSENPKSNEGNRISNIDAFNGELKNGILWATGTVRSLELLNKLEKNKELIELLIESQNEKRDAFMNRKERSFIFIYPKANEEEFKSMKNNLEKAIKIYKNELKDIKCNLEDAVKYHVKFILVESIKDKKGKVC